MQATQTQDYDFATDNNIIFRAGGADQVKLIDGVLQPVTDSDVDLGTSSLEFKDAFFDGTVTAILGLEMDCYRYRFYCW